MLFNKNRKLKNYLIYPRFQLTLIGINLVIMTFCYILVFYQVYESFNHLIEIGVRLKLPADSAFFKLLNHHENLIQEKLTIAAVISYIFSFILTIKISHKASGPIYRLSTYFRDIKENGHNKELTFRDGDYYSELPQVINEGIERISKDT